MWVKNIKKRVKHKKIINKISGERKSFYAPYIFLDRKFFFLLLFILSFTGFNSCVSVCMREIAVEKLKCVSIKRSEEKISNFSPSLQFFIKEAPEKFSTLYFFFLFFENFSHFQVPSLLFFHRKEISSPRKLQNWYFTLKGKPHPLSFSLSLSPSSIHQFHIRLSERRDEKHIITPLGRMSISLFDSSY